MRTKITNLAWLAVLSSFILHPSSLLHAAPLGTAFIYQGRLAVSANPANGIYDFRFAIYDAASSGNAIGSSFATNGVAVANGLFTVGLDCGSGVFNGDARWLAIEVRTNGGGAFTPLSPCQPLTPAPYALSAASMPGGTITSVMLADGAVTSTKLAAGAVSQLGAPDGSPTNAVQVSATGLVGVGTGTPAAGLQIVSGSPIESANVLFQVKDGMGNYTNLQEARGVVVSGNLLAVAASGDNAVTLLDISQPTAPVIRAQLKDGVGGYNALAGACGLALWNNLLAVAAVDDSAVTLIDVSNPSSPLRRAELRHGMGGFNDLALAQHVALAGDLLVIAAAGSHAVTLATVTNPSNPVVLSVIRDGMYGFDELDWPQGVALSGSLLAVASEQNSAVSLIIVTNRANPVLAAVLKDGVGGFHALDYAFGVAFSGNLLAIAALFDNAVTLVDVSNPSGPVLRSVLQHGVGGFDHLQGAYSAAFTGNLLVIGAGQDDAVTVVDVTNPSSPQLRGVFRDDLGGIRWFDQGYGPVAVATAGNLLAVASYPADSLTLLQLAARQVSLAINDWVGVGTVTPAAPLHVRGNVVVEDAASVELRATRIALGRNTSASGDGSTALGNGTEASGASAVAMGDSTLASGLASVAAGSSSAATANYAWAAGRRAKANHIGAFVWADSTDADFASTGANQFCIRAAGGVQVAPNTALNFGTQIRQMVNLWGTNYGIGVQDYTYYTRSGEGFAWFQGGSHTNVQRDPGPGGRLMMDLDWYGNLHTAGTVNPPSDRNVKANFASADSREILARLAALPVQRWNYTNDPATPHLGPTAQDFHAAFGLGADDKHIATTDADGVALAAIQGLNQKVEEQSREQGARSTELEKENATLKQEVAELKELVRSLAAKVNGGGQ